MSPGSLLSEIVNGETVGRRTTPYGDVGVLFEFPIEDGEKV